MTAKTTNIPNNSLDKVFAPIQTDEDIRKQVGYIPSYRCVVSYPNTNHPHELWNIPDDMKISECYQLLPEDTLILGVSQSKTTTYPINIGIHYALTFMGLYPEYQNKKILCVDISYVQQLDTLTTIDYQWLYCDITDENLIDKVNPIFPADVIQTALRKHPIWMSNIPTDYLNRYIDEENHRRYNLMLSKLNDTIHKINKKEHIKGSWFASSTNEDDKFINVETLKKLTDELTCGLVDYTIEKPKPLFTGFKPYEQNLKPVEVFIDRNVSFAQLEDVFNNLGNPKYIDIELFEDIIKLWQYSLKQLCDLNPEDITITQVLDWDIPSMAKDMNIQKGIEALLLGISINDLTA